MKTPPPACLVMMCLAATCLVTLSGCGALSGDAPTSTAQGQCQRRAADDPAVRAATLRANSPLQDVRVSGVHEQEMAMRRAVQRCLAGRGLAPAGGVEPVQGNWLGSPLL